MITVSLGGMWKPLTSVSVSATRAEADQIGGGPAHPFGNGLRDQARLVDDRVQLLLIGEQADHRGGHPVARLLHRAQQEHVDRRVDVVAVPGLALGHAVVQPVGDPHVLGIGGPLVQQRVHRGADLGLGAVADLEPGVIEELAVLIDAGVGERDAEGVEPFAEFVRADALQAHRVAQARTLTGSKYCETNSAAPSSSNFSR